MKKVIVGLILAAVLFLVPLTALAETAAPEAQPSTEPAVAEDQQAADAQATPTPIPTPQPTATPDQTLEYHEGAPELDLAQISSESAMLIDADTGEVLFAKNANWRIFPASTTKLMTALLVLEHCAMDEMVVIPQEVNQFSATSSLMGLRAWVGKEIPVSDLIYGLMMCSGNDAAVALAIHVAGSEDAFVQMMNEKAASLGMAGTHFLNPDGIYLANIGHDHYTTASDMTRLAQAAYQNPTLMEIMRAETYTYQTEGFSETNQIESSNYLIHTPIAKPELAPYLYDKATGMKTGTLNNIIVPGAETPIPSYGCLVASASGTGLNLIAVIFGDLSIGDKDAGIPNAYARWDIAKYLFDYGFTNFAKVDVAQYITPVSLMQQVQDVAENDPQEGSLEVNTDLSGEKTDVRLLDAATAQGLADGSIRLEQQTELEEPLAAPITQGQTLGKVSYTLNGKEVYSAPLVATRTVYPQGEEKDTSEAYGVPLFTFEMWYLWILIPAGAVLTLLVIRTINRSRRKTRYAMRGRRSGYSARHYDTPVSKQASSRGRKDAVKTINRGSARADRNTGEGTGRNRNNL